jgi:hypothetical protein
MMVIGRALAALSMALAVLAQAGPLHAQGAAPTTRPTDSPAPPPTSSTPARPGEVGRHAVQGQVISVHAQAGQVRIRTPDGATFDFPFPPAVLSAMVPGQFVTVEMTIRTQ